MTDGEHSLARARSLYDTGDDPAALAVLGRLLASPPAPAGTQYLRSLALHRSKQVVEALHAVEDELARNPEYPGAAEWFGKLNAAGSPAGTDLPFLRPWASEIEANSIPVFEHHSHRYTYKSVPLVKNVFDLAIYPLLLWELRPRTVIEVGTYYGGSAVWMADLLGNYGSDTHVYSIDVERRATVVHPRVTFMDGSGRDLAGVLTESFLASLPRPLLVIEDADHSRETTTAVLNFFHDRLLDGEHVIVEDVMTSPAAAAGLKEFLAAHASEYRINQRYCDFFGTNVTWCINGFLRRVRRPRAQAG